MRKLEIVQKYKEKKLNIITLVLKWFMLAVLCIACLILAIFGAVKLNIVQTRTVAQWTTFYTEIDLETDQCLFPFTEYLLDLARPPVNCSFCKGITGFERVSNLSQKSLLTIMHILVSPS